MGWIHMLQPFVSSILTLTQPIRVASARAKAQPLISDFDIAIHSETRVLSLPSERLLDLAATLKTSEGQRKTSDHRATSVREWFHRDDLTHSRFPERPSL